MSIAVGTKDCTALSDAELVEMADLCAEGSHPHEVGTLSKQAEAWVLITQVRDEGRLKGFAFSTLERIGGTPCVLVGLASVRRTSSATPCCGPSCRTSCAAPCSPSPTRTSWSPPASGSRAGSTPSGR